MRKFRGKIRISGFDILSLRYSLRKLSRDIKYAVKFMNLDFKKV
jgi:hypothetical protein